MSSLNLDLHQLMVFYHVAMEESISIAADKIYLTQPTISYHLKEIEKYVGVKLFNIRKQRVYLTEAGQNLFQFTKEIWEQLNNIDRYLKSLKQKPVRIGVTPLLHNQITAALSKVCKLHPEVNVEILIENSTKLIQEVSDMEIDIGIVVSTDYGNNKVKPVRISEKEKLVFVVSPNTSIAKKRKVVWADLQDYPIICGQQGSLLHTLVAENFRKVNITNSPHIMVSTLSTDALKIFVKEGNAIGLWHVKNVEEEVLAGELKILPLSEELFVPIDYISNQNDEFEKPIIKNLIKYIKQELSIPSKL